jgi:hypothetical protein
MKGRVGDNLAERSRGVIEWGQVAEASVRVWVGEQETERETGSGHLGWRLVKREIERGREFSECK